MDREVFVCVKETEEVNHIINKQDLQAMQAFTDI